MTDITLGEETITTFRQALERVSALAQARLPEALHGALQRATALVLHRHVWMDEDGKHAQVLSSDGSTYYLVNGKCTCMGVAHAPHAWCKHRLAVALYRRASELLTASRPTPPAAFPLAPFRALLAEAGVGDGRPAIPALPEAPASANARVVIDGHEVQITLRDDNEERLLVRLATLLARYPAAAWKGEQASAPAPTTGTPTCPHHGGMKESTKVKGTWFCPSKMGDGSYCKEKFPKK